MKKILINSFALIGFVTFILLACSVDDIDSNDNNNNNNNNSEIVSNNYGKYQISSAGVSNNSNVYVFVLNTENGTVMRINASVIDGNGYTFTH